MQKGFGNARLRSSVCRQGRRLCPREVKQRETLFFDKRKGVSKRILGNTHLSSHETRFFTIRSHKIFADAQIKEIIGNNPSEQFCVEREYLPMANAPPIMQEQMWKKGDVHKNAHSPKRGLTTERMFDIIYRTNACSDSDKCFQTLRHSEQQHLTKFFTLLLNYAPQAGWFPILFSYPITDLRLLRF